MLAALLAIVVLAACGSGSPGPQASSTKAATSTGPAASPTHPASTPASPPAPPLGVAGGYRVGQLQLTFTEPAPSGATGQTGPRPLPTTVLYPLAPQSAGSPSASPEPASGPLPLLVFAPGFLQCASSYQNLLQTWASAGYVVAAVTFPRTNCQLGNTADETDVVNQPADLSYVLSSLLELGAQSHNSFGLLSIHEIGAAGQSDGGDTVAALGANTCCTDHRLTAVAVLSGAVWPAMPGQYFTGSAPPMLFTQGNMDTINPPWAGVQLYRSDVAGARYYLNLLGASHMVPYSGTNPAEQVVARVTLAFFDRYVLGQTGALATMTQDGHVPGTATLVSGGHVPHDAG